MRWLPPWRERPAVHEISPELDGISVALIGYAIDLLEAGAELPVTLASDAEDGVVSFEDDTADGCYRAACEHVAGLGAACTRYALIYDGVVQEDPAQPACDALLFEFAERGMPHAWSGYVLYRRAADGSIEVTDPLPGGEEELLFG